MTTVNCGATTLATLKKKIAYNGDANLTIEENVRFEPKADEQTLSRLIFLRQPGKWSRLERFESKPEKRDIREGKDYEGVSAINR